MVGVAIMNDDWELTNWTMAEKAKEILVFFEMFCGFIVVADILMCKLIDFLER